MTDKIKIGTNINGQPTFYTDNKWGVNQIWARPRYGKTCMAKTLIVRMAQNRPIIAFDFYGDWKGMADYNWKIQDPNYNKKWEYSFPERVENLKIVNNPAFQISDFDRDEDWLSWGFPREAARAMSELASSVEAHADNPELFYEMLKNLPTDELESREFTNEYGNDLRVSYVFPASKRSMLVRWQYISELFEQPRTVKHWGEFMLRHNQIVVNYDLRDDPNRGVFKARAFTGKILSQLKDNIPGTRISYLEKLQPIIILEEADKLLPQLPLEEESSVFNEVMEIGLKLQRTGTALFLITQDPNRLDRDVSRMFYTKIMGKIPVSNPKTPHEELTYDLRWDPPNNERQFVIISENGRWEIFKPDFCPCK